MKPLLLVALLLASTAGAQVQKWEYASLSIYNYFGNIDEMQRNVPKEIHYLWFGQNPALYGTNDPKGDDKAFLKRVFGNAYIDLQDLNFDLPYMQNEFGKIGWELVSLSETCSIGCIYVKDHNKPNDLMYYKVENYWYKRPVTK